MKNNTVFDCKIIEFKKQSNNITIENEIDIPFDVKRIYYLYDVKNSSIRGTNGITNGIVPMLRVFTNTARYVDQGGGKRNGSIAIYL